MALHNEILLLDRLSHHAPQGGLSEGVILQEGIFTSFQNSSLLKSGGFSKWVSHRTSQYLVSRCVISFQNFYGSLSTDVLCSHIVLSIIGLLLK